MPSSNFSTLPSDDLASLRARLSIAVNALREIATAKGTEAARARSRAELALSFLESESTTDWSPPTQV